MRNLHGKLDDARLQLQHQNLSPEQAACAARQLVRLSQLMLDEGSVHAELANV